jgi:hypothetical protein
LLARELDEQDALLADALRAVDASGALFCADRSGLTLRRITCVAAAGAPPPPSPAPSPSPSPSPAPVICGGALTLGTLAGSGAAWYADGAAPAAAFRTPHAFAGSAAPGAVLYVADAGASAGPLGGGFLRVLSNGAVSTAAGSFGNLATANTDSFGARSGLALPSGVALDAVAGGLVVAETLTNSVRPSETSDGNATPKLIPDGAAQVKHFWLAGEDRVWHPA